MQTLRSTVSELVYKLGKNPIIIISQDPRDADVISQFLSTAIIDSQEIKNTYPIIQKSDLFSSHSINSLLQKDPDNAKGLKLLIEEGLDAKKLFGVKINSELFFKINNLQFDNPPFYITLYSLPWQLPSSSKPYDEFYNSWKKQQTKLLKLHISNKTNSLFLNINDLAVHCGDFIQKVNKQYLLNNKTDYQNIVLTFQNDPFFITKYTHIRKKEHLNNLLIEVEKNNTFHVQNMEINNGKKLSVIIKNCRKESDVRQLISTYFSEFSIPPQLHFICETADEAKSLTTAFKDLKGRLPVYFKEKKRSVNQTINDCIALGNAEYVYITDGIIRKSVLNLINTKRNGDYQFLTAQNNVSSEMDVDYNDLHLSDILSKSVIENNILFDTKLWKRFGGFDETLDFEGSLWDFTIRTLLEKKTKACIVNFKHLNLNAAPTFSVSAETAFKIVKKHERLFKENIEFLISSLQTEDSRTKEETIALLKKIESLNFLLNNARQQIQSANELSSLLQHKLSYFENRWYIKLADKLKKLKHIIFSRKGTKKGRLRKYFDLIVFTFSKPGLSLLKKIVKNASKKLYIKLEERPILITYLDEEIKSSFRTYHDWIKAKLNPEILLPEIHNGLQNFKQMPKISIVMPVYNPPLHYLMSAIDSILEQPYKNWELCIADDCSDNSKIIDLLKSYQKIYENIKVVFRKENGHISATTNSALEIATGDYILFMDHDDLITQNCLYEVAKHITENPDVEIIYSDEDKIDDAGMHTVPFFKPDWSPHNLLAKNYFGHVVVMKKELVNRLGGCRIGFEGSQDYDLILRAVECTGKIGHIPKVLYHWRIHSLSAAQSEEVKPYAYIAAKKAIYESIERQGLSGDIKFLAGLRGYSVRFNVLNEGKVSIIIPSKDQAGLLENCLESIYNLTGYKNFEIIVINNNSSSSEFFKLIKKYKEMHADSFRSIDLNIPFNFAALMNKGVEISTGEYILLLNNDIEVIHTDWLYNMAAYAQLKNIGAVGAKLLYPDDTIQHAGVIIGLGGVAGHSFVNQHKDDPGYFNYIQSVTNYSAVTAACLMCRKEVFLEVNGMEEELAVEYNDVDLCLKMIDKGYHNVYLPHVELYHFESVSRGHPHLSIESYERHVKEIGIFSKKWEKYIKNDPCYNPNLNMGVHDFSMNFSA